MRRASCALVWLFSNGCSNTADPGSDRGLAVEVVVTGLSAPLFLTSPPGDARLFIVEQTGAIRIVKGGQLLPAPYLDIASKISLGGERGLLGLAFHPNFSQNGLFYVNYTDVNGNTVVERYTAVPAADAADVSSASLVLGIAQPDINHNGGMLLFGPDGTLWIGTGDGGGSGDPLGNGQSLTTLLGKMLRIDVDAPSDGLAYGIPPDNPFASSSTMRREIWGWGLRNPWRYSFDRATNALYVADVGQNFFEEVHVVSHTAASVNYGWNIMEGKHCYAADRCDTFGLNRPVIDYDHTEGCSVTGGYVYRGSRIPSIYGRYFYSDVCSGFLRSFRFYRGAVIEQRDWDIGDLGSVTSFGEGSDGELYIVSGEGTVFRLIPGPHLTLRAMQLRSGTARNQSN